MRTAEQGARNAATSKWMTMLARCGYAAKGVVYLIIGGIAAQVAIGARGAVTDQKGALQTILAQPFGRILLGVVAIGLFGFALWCFIQAVFDTEGKGIKAKGLIARIGYAAVGYCRPGAFCLWHLFAGGSPLPACWESLIGQGYVVSSLHCSQMRVSFCSIVDALEDLQR
jgi:hypothetical protein